MAAFTFDCQKCGAPIMAGEDMVGKRGRCPHCSTIFSIPDPHTAIAPSAAPLRAPVAPDIDRAGQGWREIVDDDAPRGRPASRRPPRDERDDHDDDYDAPYDHDARRLARLSPGWSTVSSGLSLMRTGMIIFIVITLVMVLVVVLSLAARGDFGRNRQAEMLMGIVALVGGLTGLVAIILFIVGQCMCCATPPESGAKGQAVGSAICLFSGVGLGLVGFVFLIISFERRGPREGVAVMAAGMLLLAAVLFITCHVLLVLFLRGVGRYFRNEQLASSTGTYMILYGIFVAFYLLALFLTVIVNSTGRAQDAAALGVLLVILGVGLVVFALILFLYFLDLLARTRGTITRATEEPR